MEGYSHIEKNQKTIRVFSWIIIIAATLSLFIGVFGLITSPNASSMHEYTKIITTSVGIKINSYVNIMLDSIKILINALLVFSAVFLLRYKETWRKQVILWLIIAIIYLMISPLLNYIYFPQINFYNMKNIPINIRKIARIHTLMSAYLWSIIWTVFFIVVIVKLNKKEIKLLFK